MKASRSRHMNLPRLIHFLRPLPSDSADRQGKGGKTAPVLGLGLAFAALLAMLIAPDFAWSQEAKKFPFPRFRSIDADAPPANAPPVTTIKLLAETDFAPWSFTLEDGTIGGISVDIAKSACEDASLVCQIVPTPFIGLVPALSRGEGDVIVSGLRLNADLVSNTVLTRPYFRSTARFVIRKGTQLAGADPKSLVGRRIGVMRGTAHEAFLQKYYGKTTIVPHDREVDMYETLRTGALDMIFGDSIRMSFWMNSDGARNCCQGLGSSMIDAETFSRPLVFVLRKDEESLRDRLDEALDHIEEKGTTGEIFARYLPISIW